MTDEAMVQEPHALRLAEKIDIAEDFASRLSGLLFRDLKEGEGLYISPCTSIHTLFMKYAIDAVFVDGEGRALAAYHSLPAWRVTRWIPRAAGVLELPAGTLKRHGFEAGALIELPEGRKAPARGRLGRIAANVLLSMFWIYLAGMILPDLLRGTASLSAYLLFAVNSVIAFLFLARREEKRVTESLRDRLATLACILMSFSLRPAVGASLVPQALGSGLLVMSLALILAAYLSLGRSFGLIPADRGVKLGGLYAWVRHPLYGAEMAFFAAFVLANFTLKNVVFLAGIVVTIHLRALAEERLLAHDEAYREYCTRVSARYIPHMV